MSPESKRLFSLAEQELLRHVTTSQKLGHAMISSVRTMMKGKYSFATRGLKPGCYRTLVCNSTTRPALMVELEYMTNEKGAKKLLDRGCQSLYARGIKQAIVDHFHLRLRKK